MEAILLNINLLYDEEKTSDQEITDENNVFNLFLFYTHT